MYRYNLNQNGLLVARVARLLRVEDAASLEASQRIVPLGRLGCLVVFLVLLEASGPHLWRER